MFKMIKEAAAMKDKLAEVEKQLKHTILTTEHKGVKVTTNGKAEILDLELSPDLVTLGQKEIEQTTLAALQLATKKAHDTMAEESKKLTGGLSLPGLT